MGKKIITSGRVHLEHDGGVVTLRPGDEVPAWADKIVTNPALFQGQPEPVEPEPEPKAPVKEPAKKPTRRKKPVKKADTPESTADLSRDALIEKLTEKGIEFEADNTDDELALILENAE